MAQQVREVKVVGVYTHEKDEVTQAQHFILLQDDTGRRMPIWIGRFEAWAISFALESDPPERPMTHDMIVMTLKATGATLVEAVIRDLREETFYSDLTLCLHTGEVKTLDTRPSDAIAVALKADCPIYVAEHVLATAAKAT